MPFVLDNVARDDFPRLTLSELEEHALQSIAVQRQLRRLL